MTGTDHFQPSEVWLWDLSSNHGKPLSLDATRNVLFVAFSPDGRRVLTVQDGLAQLWDPTSGAAIGPSIASPRPPDRAATSINWMSGRQMQSWGAFAAGGKIVLASVGDAAVHRLEAESGVALPGGPIPAREPVQAIAVSGNGERFIAQLADMTAQVWDVNTGRPAGPPLKPAEGQWQASIARRISESTPAIALSADGRAALTTSEGAVHVWETETGLPIGPPLQVRGVVERVLLCDPSIVMAFTRSDTVQVWDLSPGEVPDTGLVRLSGLLSGRRIEPDGAVALVPADVFARAAWSDFHGRQPELPEGPSESIADWHLRKAGESESTGDPFAAVVHLDPLVAASPDDLDLRRRRAGAEAELGRWAAAAADFAVVVKRNPNDTDAKISLAVLSARLGNRDAYRLASRSLVAPIRRIVDPRTAVAPIQAATLQPAGLDDPEALVKVMEPATRFFSKDFGFLSTLAFANYRAGHYEAARQTALNSIAVYAQSDTKDITPELRLRHSA